MILYYIRRRHTQRDFKLHGSNNGGLFISKDETRIRRETGKESGSTYRNTGKVKLCNKRGAPRRARQGCLEIWPYLQLPPSVAYNW